MKRLVIKKKGNMIITPIHKAHDTLSNLVKRIRARRKK
jgi:hypothetical protein